MKITLTVLVFGTIVLGLLLTSKPNTKIIYVQPDMNDYISKTEHTRQIDCLTKMNQYQAAKDMKTILMLKNKLEKN